MAGRQPLGPSGAHNGVALAPFGSPAKLGGGHPAASDPEEQFEISAESVAKNAARVIEALEAESPPPNQTSHRDEHTPTEQEGALALVPAAGSTQPADSLLIRRLASDVAADADFVAAWGEVEALRQQLRRKDEELRVALEALEAAQACGESPQAVQRHQESAGQQLARFLKDQLSSRDAELSAAQQEAAGLQQQLHRQATLLETCQQRLGAAHADAAEAREEAGALRCQREGLQQELQEARALAEQHAEAAAFARLEAEEARREAAAELQRLRSEAWAVEARSSLAAPAARGSGWPEEAQGSISLEQPGTAHHSVGDEAAVDEVAGAPAAQQQEDGAEEVEDVFSSPVLSSLRASSSPEPRQQHEQQGDAAPTRTSFEFATAGSRPPRAGADGSASGSSDGESEATVSEAAVVARTLTRASALQKDRQQLRGQVRDLSQELRDLKGQQRHVARHMLAAHAAGGGAGGGPDAAQRRRTQAAARLTDLEQEEEGRAAEEAGLAERCRLHAAEERHLRSEVETLNRKCDRSNELLLKANHAMKILHYKLQKERKAVAHLQDERCHLQARLLAGGDAGGGDPRQLALLLLELQTGRARVEGLLEERAALGARLEAVASGGASREQREAAAAAVAALQQHQEAVAAALREELGAERARAASLADERGELEGRLREALGLLAGAEQISGQLDQARCSSHRPAIG